MRSVNLRRILSFYHYNIWKPKRFRFFKKEELFILKAHILIYARQGEFRLLSFVLTYTFLCFSPVENFSFFSGFSVSSTRFKFLKKKGKIASSYLYNVSTARLRKKRKKIAWSVLLMLFDMRLMTKKCILCASIKINGWVERS